MTKKVFFDKQSRLRESLAVKESGAIGVRWYSERRLTKKAKCGGCPPHKNLLAFDFANTIHILRYVKTINIFAVRGFIDSLSYRKRLSFGSFRLLINYLKKVIWGTV